MNHPKRLIEVDLPIKRISEHARREKSIRHGHISTMHIWWARRPLAACRAVLCASLWPDPADSNCPKEFIDTAICLILDFAKTVSTNKDLAKYSSPDIWKKWLELYKSEKRFDINVFGDMLQLRDHLLDFIADYANWDNCNNNKYNNISNKLTMAANASMNSNIGAKPLAIDPFAGGGAIPLEALRVGADVFASDLNPIPILLNKAVLEYIPKYGMRLADDIVKYGKVIKDMAIEELSEIYPVDPDGSSPIAFLWARTIICEGPACGVEVPLIKSLYLAKKGKKSTFLKMHIDKANKIIDFEISKDQLSDARGTLKRGSATCPICGYTTPGDNVRKQFVSKKGGANYSKLLAVYCEGKNGRHYRHPNDNDIIAVDKAKKLCEKYVDSKLYNNIATIPDEPLPYLRSIFNVNLIGMNRWSDLFSSRQLVAIITLCNAINRIKVMLDGENKDYSKALLTFLAFAVDRQADYCTSICTWVQSGEFIGHNFAQGQSLPIKWDFAEVSPFANGSGNWDGAIDWIARVISNISSTNLSVGNVQQLSATEHVLPDDSADIIFTDPPYYDAIPYADLSDFFYVWLKRSIGECYPELFRSGLTPKEKEVVQLAERNQIYAYKTKANFEKLMSMALMEGRRVVKPEGIGVFVFAHKDTSAWETMLQSVLNAGWIATASWPIDTEMAARLRAKGSAALASSVHLVCRPRENADGSLRVDEVGDWRDVLTELPKKIEDWMPRLAKEGVVGADAIFACLGPALEVFSKYSRVEKASGDHVELREYLEHVWAVVSKVALNMIFSGAETSGFEEDARLTAMWLWTISTGTIPDDTSSEVDDSDDEDTSTKQTNNGYSLEYDAARKIAQGLGANLEALRSLVEIKGEIARLIPVEERAQYLFGKDSGQEPAKRKKKEAQMSLFQVLPQDEDTSSWDVKSAGKIGDTVLDRLHQSMILFAAGRGEALKRFLVEDGVGRDARFWPLAQAFSALYPAGSDEKRWVDGVLARKKGLGF